MVENKDEIKDLNQPDPVLDTSDEDTRKPITYRTIFISDIHLGTSGAQCRPLLDFLKYSNSDKLYLVGDIIDGWRLKRKWYWPQLHNDVVQKILRKARHGTEVIYVPGNHDEFARGYLDLSFGGIQIKASDIHETIKGEKFWVVHGDLFDNVIQHARWLAHLGDFAYKTLLVLNRWLNAYRRLLRRPYWSLSQYLKHKVKSAVSFMSAFETVMSKETARRDCDGIICGHIHKAELKHIGPIIYANCGDWVESATALVEHHDGTLEILYWSEQGLIKRQRLDQLHDSLTDSEVIKP